MENEKNTGRVWLIILAVLAVLAAVLVVLYRLDKRVQRLYYQLGYKLTPKKYGIPAVILASLIALSRIYVGVHYPTDVLGGLVIAFVSSLWGCYLVKCMYIRMKERSCHD